MGRQNMSLTYEQVIMLMEKLKVGVNKRQASRLEKVISLKSSQFTFERIMGIITPNSVDETLKKPHNAWQLYLSDFRKSSEVEPGMNGSDIVSKASPIWKGMSEKEKRPYLEKAKELSDEYRKAKEEIKPAKELK